ncbi:MAG: STAS domain-containing protein [Spongiibacteraceae bacterium]|jgi:phospholipid transport system transporter-binding protein|nr:STAS domain-containing protein [Spongiibacteraceae bacterium]
MTKRRATAQPSFAAARFDNDAVSLSGTLDFETVIGLDNDVAPWLRDRMPATCTVDLAEVAYSNSAGIALLLGWMRIAQQGGGKLVLRAVPEDMQALAKVGGLPELFCPE